jgi:starch synthase
VVRSTGGLEDTIEEFHPASGNGTGFKFAEYNSGALLKAVQRAASVYADSAAWRKLMKNGMAKDFSWEASARKYIQLYRSLTRK